MQESEKEFVILALVEYICDKEGKSNFVLEKIYELLVKEKLVARGLISDSKDERIKFVLNMLNEIEFSKSEDLAITEFKQTKKNIVMPITNEEQIMQTHIDKLFKLSTRSTVKDLNNASNLSVLIKNNQRCYHNFIKLETLGNGGFGKVYKTRSILDKSNYAIKKIFVDTRYKKMEYYLSEVELLSKLNHENIIRYYATWIEFKYIDAEKLESATSITSKDSDCDTSISKYNNMLTLCEIRAIKYLVPVLYIQMELCDTTLKNYLLERNKLECLSVGVSLEPEKINSIMLQLVGAVKYIHNQGIIHQDITPQNIFINYIDQKISVKLGDFGLSIDENKSHNANYKSIANTMYGAPEVEMSINKTCMVDIYSLGIIYYELCSKFNTVMERVITLKKLRDFSCSENIDYYCSNLRNDNVMQVMEDTKIKQSDNDLEILSTLGRLICFCDVSILLSMLHYDPSKRINAETLYDKLNYSDSCF